MNVHAALQQAKTRTHTQPRTLKLAWACTQTYTCMYVHIVTHTSVLEAVGFDAASTASACALPLASDCRYFISSYPIHQIGSALQNPDTYT